jgi:hypothetical protein
MSSTHWKVPGYVIEQLLGVGGSSEVWRARVSASGDQVALKRIALPGIASLGAARHEAAMLSTLDHPHLVRLHDLVLTDEAVVLVLDLAEGGSLANLIAQRGRLIPGEVVTALSPIGAALAYAHGHGIIHGDVTPGNVLFTRDGRPLLADLGVARIVGDDDLVSSTPAYVDPIVAAGGAPAASSDVFMLAAVAVHALTGRPVWAGADASAVVAEAAAGDLVDLPGRLAALPPALGDLLTRALAREPARRSTAAEFALDLRQAAEPSVVELRAGRPAVEPRVAQPTAANPGVPDRPRPTAAAPYAGVHRTDGPRRTLAGRPPFERPPMSVSTGASAQFTHTIRAALRPTLPPAHRRALVVLVHRGLLLLVARRRGVLAAAIGAVVLAALVAAVTGLVHLPSSAAQASAPVVARSPTAEKSTSRGPAAPATESPTVVLAQLDALRGQAFERNQPALLTQVYLPGPLLEQDTALLRKVVRPGCALLGVHTTFAVTQVAGIGPELITVRVQATLAPSTLVCAGLPTATEPGAGPTTLRIALMRSGQHYRVASQQVVT